LTIQLLDNKGTRDQPLASTTISDGTATLNLPASQTDNPLGMYYLALGSVCSSYSTDLEPAGQFSVPPAPTFKGMHPGDSISAAPQLLSGITYTSAGFPGTNWYSLYKRSDATPGTIRIVTGACAPNATITLLDANGVADTPVTWITPTHMDSAVTFTVPGRRASDPTGLYYLTIYGCGQRTIDPEPAGEFIAHPTVAWTQPLLGTSAAQAWPNLVGGRRYLPGQYPQVIPKTRWYTLSKLRDTRPATVRVVDATGPGSSGCVVRLYNSASAAARPIAAKVLNANEAVTFSVPARRAGGSGLIDQYYLSLSSSSSCGYLSRTVSPGVIEPEPASAWGWGIHASITGTAKSSATSMRFGQNYAGTTTASRRQVWAKFTVGGPVTFLGTSITSHKPFWTAACVPGQELLDPAGHVVSTFSWSVDQVAKVSLRTKGTYYLHVWFPSSCTPPASYEFITQVRS
jgi:hypothetical protein